MRVDALNSRGRLVHTDVSLHELGVGEALREAAAEPDRLAVVDPASGRRLTYVELPAQSQRVAHGLPSAWPHLLPRQVGVSMALAAAQARSPPPTASTRRLRHPGCAGPGQLPSVSLRRRRPVQLRTVSRGGTFQWMAVRSDERHHLFGRRTREVGAGSPQPSGFHGKPLCQCS